MLVSRETVVPGPGSWGPATYLRVEDVAGLTLDRMSPMT